jgi:cell division protein ZapA (FtsZ GTPase activity inhibitor)
MVKDTHTINLTVPVTVIIAGRPYLLKVNANDEGAIQRMASDLNDKIAFFQQANPARDKQDCLSLTLMTYAVELQRAVGAAAVQDAAPATRPAV